MPPARRRPARCSPSAQITASARLLLPEPFGPTTTLMPGPSSSEIASANDLNPRTVRRLSTQLRLRQLARGPRRAASRSDACLEGPRPRPSTSPPTRTRLVNARRCGGPGGVDQLVGHRQAAGGRRAPGGSSWGRARRATAASSAGPNASSTAARGLRRRRGRATPAPIAASASAARTVTRPASSAARLAPPRRGGGDEGPRQAAGRRRPPRRTRGRRRPAASRRGRPRPRQGDGA